MDQETTLPEVFGGKKGILFGVPGAFTPGCQEVHVPGYMEKAEEFKKAGAEVIAVISTNDAFVMQEWAKATGGTEKGIVFLSDFTGQVAKKMDLSQDLPPLNTNPRFKRFSAVIADNEVKVLNVEPDGTGKSVSLAEPTLEQFKGL